MKFIYRNIIILLVLSTLGWNCPVFAYSQYAFDNPAPALSDETMIDDARRYASGIEFGLGSLKQQLMAMKAEADQQSSMMANGSMVKKMKPAVVGEGDAKNAMAMDSHAAPMAASSPLMALKFWHQLTEQPAFTTRQKSLATQLDNWLDAPYSEARSQALSEVKEGYSQLLHDFNAGEYLYSAKIAAEKARHNLEMYRKMKYVTQSGPERDRAHALFADAENAIDASEIARALTLWEQAAKAFNEDAFQEVIAGFVAANEAGDKRANLKLEAIRLKVEALLDNYFVQVPAGALQMGSEDGDDDERPMQSHAVASFKLGREEVSFALWDLCVKTRACYRSPEHHINSGVPREHLAVVGISGEEILEQFIPWLHLMTGRQYRLPTEIEWEYAAKAGAQTDFSWGPRPDCSLAHFKGRPSDGCSLTPQPARVGERPANAFGLHDMHGNVWEWTASCYTHTLDESATVPCTLWVIRGGSWRDSPQAMRASNRIAYPFNRVKPTLGFRIVEMD